MISGAGCAPSLTLGSHNWHLGAQLFSAAALICLITAVNGKGDIAEGGDLWTSLIHPFLPDGLRPPCRHLLLSGRALAPQGCLGLQPRALPKVTADSILAPPPPKPEIPVMFSTLCLFQRLRVTDGETEARRVGGSIKVPVTWRAQTKQNLGPQPGFSNSCVYVFVILSLLGQPPSSSLKTPSSEGAFLPLSVSSGDLMGWPWP